MSGRARFLIIALAFKSRLKLEFKSDLMSRLGVMRIGTEVGKSKDAPPVKK